MPKDEMRAAILGADDLPREPVDVPWELDGKLYVRGLTAAEKDAWMARTMPDGNFAWTNNLTAELLVKTIVDEDGVRIFADNDAAALGTKGAAVLSLLFATAMRLSGLSEDTEEQVEEAFATGQSSVSDIG